MDELVSSFLIWPNQMWHSSRCNSKYLDKDGLPGQDCDCCADKVNAMLTACKSVLEKHKPGKVALNWGMIEEYIRELSWSKDTPDIHKTLVAGNIRAFASKFGEFAAPSLPTVKEIDNILEKCGIVGCQSRIMTARAIHALLTNPGGEKPSTPDIDDTNDYACDGD